jgi:uncharacterized coiled-coil protein SlyX
MPTAAEIEALRARLEETERAYAGALAALDALANRPPAEDATPHPLAELARPREPAARPDGTGLAGAFDRRAWDAAAPALEAQAAFDERLLQVLHHLAAEQSQNAARVREALAALLRVLQRVQPVMDLRDRVASAHATLASERKLEILDRRTEALASRLRALAPRR